MKMSKNGKINIGTKTIIVTKTDNATKNNSPTIVT